jgi:diaminohydroxyphosphoribosylaminopyrimidine deaminase/5-amino-6-(5-phosphoribosylamino)uracil reductase
VKPSRSGDRQVIDERFMRRALELARRGRATTRPNPMVGALVVRDGRVLGQGFHRRVGEAHAEVLALQATTKAGQDARGATLYATLEPCCHTGRTGPCTKAILDAGIARVVVACRDPYAQVNGGRGDGRRRLPGSRGLGPEPAVLHLGDARPAAGDAEGGGNA